MRPELNFHSSRIGKTELVTMADKATRGTGRDKVGDIPPSPGPQGPSPLDGRVLECGTGRDKVVDFPPSSGPQDPSPPGGVVSSCGYGRGKIEAYSTFKTDK
ncbi:uncharacterized protein LOC124273548 [Haliotis rubra]|uniref:uncharacterized protein LOC124273548 n=1 Tax=Haliotis rubra TaxID=36100 RepID=UPI001EE5EA0F|nr:uncharacterized protein LOC124273548 [Haliotis rubra]